MITPTLSGALENLKVAAKDDLSRYLAAVEAGRQIGWSYYFPYLLSRNRPGRRAILLEEDSGSMCVYLWQVRDDKPRLDVYLAPSPMDVAVLERAIERANDFNGDRSARVMRIDAKDVDAVSAARIRVSERKTQYIFVPGAYDDLGGKAFYTIRRNVALIERLSDVQVMPYSTSHAEACRMLLKRWKKAHREAHGTYGEITTSRSAIELAGTLPDSVLSGQVIFVGDRLVAFAFGGAIRPGFACSFERKCDNDIRGLSYYQLRSLLLGLQEFEYVNDGSDAGRAGLHQLKQSFRPVDMHTEYRGRQR